jgi:hypothetical protein
MVRAAKLDSELYEEVEADKSATGQALGVVVLSNLAAGIGTIGMTGTYGGLVTGAVLAIAGWFIWAFLTYWIGTRWLPEPQTQADLRQLLRTTGFSSSPGLIRALGVLPGFTSIVFLIAGVWMLATMVIAVKQALDFQSTGRAVGVCIIGWLIQAAALFLILTLGAKETGSWLE